MGNAYSLMTVKLEAWEKQIKEGQREKVFGNICDCSHLHLVDYVTHVPLTSFLFQGSAGCPPLPRTDKFSSKIIPCNLSSRTQLYLLREAFGDELHNSIPLSWHSLSFSPVESLQNSTLDAILLLNCCLFAFPNSTVAGCEHQKKGDVLSWAPLSPATRRAPGS